MKKSIIVLLIFSIMTLVNCGSSDKELPLSEKYSPTNAYYESHQFVKEQLKSPSTAKFVHVSEASIEKENDTTFIIVGHFDSQNGFGAMIRSDYVCKITYLDFTGMVRCDDIAIY